MATNLTTPVGRLVGGSVYELTEQKDQNGQVKMKDGKPQLVNWFHLAIPKGAERHWAETEWGSKVWAEGHKAHPTFAPHPTFAWKIEDGDSQVPNKRGKRNCDLEGHPGHWIMKFSRPFAPKVFNKDGSAPIVEPGAVKTGYYVQVNFDVSGNTGPTPGVYLNQLMVALSAYGPEISFGPDVAAAGFGQAPLPAGAMATPPASFAPPAPAVPTAPAIPAAVTAPVVPPAMPVPTAAIVPNPAFLQVPTAPAPVMPPPVPARRLTPAAGGATYEQLIAAGWNDALLVQQGLMLP